MVQDAKRQVRRVSKRWTGPGRGRVRVETEGATLTIANRSGRPIAQFRFEARSEKWTLFWPDANGRWHPYEEVPSSARIEPLIDEVDRDPTDVFWG